jgi:hypothetical protein
MSQHVQKNGTVPFSSNRNCESLFSIMQSFKKVRPETLNKITRNKGKKRV